MRKKTESEAFLIKNSIYCDADMLEFAEAFPNHIIRILISS